MSSVTAGVEMPQVDVVVLAGGVTSPEDPMYAVLGPRPKSLLPLAERPMIAYVLEALTASPQVRRVAVVGLPSDAGTTLGEGYLPVPDQGGIVSNALAGIRSLANGSPDQLILICTADAPLLSPDTFQALLAAAAPYDASFYYPVVSRETMEAAFPNARRTYGRLREGELTGGNVALVKAGIAESHIPFWEALTEARKHPLRLARIIGPLVVLKALLRLLSVRDVERRAQKKIGLRVLAVSMDRAEIAMDIDKPHQIDIVLPLLATQRSSE